MLASSGAALYLALEDKMAGRPNRFTVHRISFDGMKKTTVIGRELPIGFARRLANEKAAKD